MTTGRRLLLVCALALVVPVSVWSFGEQDGVEVRDTGTEAGTSWILDLFGFGAIDQSATDGPITITAPPDPYNGVVGDEPGELYIVENRQMALVGFGAAIPSSIYNNFELILPTTMAATVTKVCCKIDSGALTINIQRNDGTAANMLSSNLVCSTTMNADTGVGCTETFVGGEASIAVGELGQLTIIGTPTATRASVAWTEVSLSP